MCFALVHQIISLENDQAIVENEKRINLNLVKKCKPGDWVLVQANMAVEKITAQRAKDLNHLRPITNKDKSHAQ